MASASVIAEAGPTLLERAESVYVGAVSAPRSYIGTAAQLLADCEAANDHEAYVVALRALGWIEHLCVGNAAARERLDQAVRFAERHSVEHRLPEVLASRAAIQHELGRMAAAQRDLDRALALADATPNGHDTTWCQIALQQGALFHNQGRLAQAEELYRRLLAMPGCPQDIAAKVGNNLAHLLTMRGDATEGLAWAEQAMATARSVGPAVQAVVSQTYAWVLLHSGDIPASLEAFAEAERRYDQAGMSTADLSLEHADALVDLRLIREAAAATDQAVWELDRLGAPLMSAEARMRRARLGMLLGEFDQARSQVDRAIEDLRRQRRPTWLATATITWAELALTTGTVTPAVLTGARRAAATLDQRGVSGAVEAHLVAGRVAARLGRTARAVESWRRAAHLAPGRTVLIRLRGRVAAALAHEAEGRPRDVARQCRLGLDDLARHRAALPSMELRALASGHGEQLGELGLRALLPSATPARVLGWLERTRAASLVVVDPPPPEEIRSDLAALRTLHGELREARRGQQPESTPVQQRIKAVESRIRQASWRGAVPAAPSAADASRPGPTPSEIRAALDGATLVEYALLDGRLLAVVVDGRRSRLVELGAYQAVQAEREALAFATRRLGRGTRAAAALTACDQAIDRLRTLLVHPLGAGDAPLVVVPAGGLYGVPWSALHHQPISLTPSAALYLHTSELHTSDTARSATPGDDATALVAGPDLPGAIAEVSILEAVHAVAGRSVRALLPPQSTADAVTDQLARASLVHLSCHGFLRTDNPTFSALQLADGPLTVQELSGTQRLARRIVLAACRSGDQATYAGNEVLGFVSALLSRGTAGVVAATVPVPDGESVPLMQGLHERLVAGRTLAAALCEARHAMGRSALDFGDSPLEYLAWYAYTAYGAA